MYDPEQWKYVGQCIECGASMWEMDGELKPSCPVEEGHYCSLGEPKEEQ